MKDFITTMFYLYMSTEESGSITLLSKVSYNLYGKDSNWYF